MLLRTVLVATAIGLGLTSVVAQQDPIAARRALMKQNQQGVEAVSRMVKGEQPFDAARADAAFAQWSETAEKFGALFPENTKTGDTRAAPAIWDNRPGFDAALAKFGKDVADNRPKGTTLDGLKAAMPAVGRNCGGCHQEFRRAQS